MGFGSLEALTTTADVALQIALAGGLDEQVQELQELLMADFLERLYKKHKQSGRDVSKRCTSNVCKIPITSYENGYTTSEASVITGAMAVAMWKLLNTLLIS
jgi:hypothetical protein